MDTERGSRREKEGERWREREGEKSPECLNVLPDGRFQNMADGHSVRHSSNRPGTRLHTGGEENTEACGEGGGLEEFWGGFGRQMPQSSETWTTLPIIPRSQLSSRYMQLYNGISVALWLSTFWLSRIKATTIYIGRYLGD